jgi:murein DD-endopeptidase MepM/ murein hydrolase activator NlpD
VTTLLRLQILFFGLTISAMAQARYFLNQDTAWPGGIATIDLGPADRKPPRAWFGHDPVAVITHEGHYKALVGLPLSQKPGKAQIIVEQGAGRQTRSFTVTGKKYAQQHISLPAGKKSYNNPGHQDLARFAQEKMVTAKAFNHFSPEMPDIRFLKPAEGPYSSQFGLQRFFDNVPRKPHTGLDIAAPEHAPVIAPTSGTVRLTGHHYFNGNTLIIDHGMGLMTFFCHLNSISVKEGERVHKGQQIGRVGRTGRATGPHLHFSVNMNNVRVDPALFMHDAGTNN